MKKILSKLSLLKIITFILVVAILFSFVSKIPEYTLKYTKVAVVNPEGINELSAANAVISKEIDGAVKVASNGGKSLYVIPKTLNVIVVDDATGTTWKSIPTEGSLTEAEKAPLNISFLDATGAVKNWDAYTYCIARDNTTRELEAGESLADTYTINRIDNGFRATLEVSESESTELDQYMPKKISIARYTECFLDKIVELQDAGKITEDDAVKYNKALSMIYAIDAETEDYYYNKYAGTPPVTVTKILIDLSKKVEYSQEDLINDSREFDITDVEFSKPAHFTIIVDVTLEDGDLSVNIPVHKIVNKSGLEAEVIEKLESGELSDKEKAAIKEEADSNYKLQKIAVFPNFGLVNATSFNEGFIFVPDGSGALFNINSYDSGYVEYKRPIYDNTYYDTLYTNTEYKEDLMMPVFGMGTKGAAYMVAEEAPAEEEAPLEEATEEVTEVEEPEKDEVVQIKTENKGDAMTGFMGIIESGAETASIAVNLGVKDTSNGGTNFNKVYPAFDVMQYSNVKVFGPYSTNEAKFLATTAQFDVDIKVRYELYTENCNYYEMAMDYRDYLISKNPDITVDYEGAPEIFLDVVSAITLEERFMGVPYDSTVSMTTYSELNEILTDLAGVETVVSYKGAYNGGIYNTLNLDAKRTGENGSKKDYNQLMSEHGESIYMTTPISYVYKDTAVFNANKHALLGYDSEPVQVYNYDIPTGRFNILGEGHWIVSPYYLPKVVESFAKSAGTVKLGIEDLGNLVYAHYKPETEVNLFEGQQVVKQALETLTADDRSIILYNPIASRMLYADYCADVSRESSDYGLIEHNVPFRQLVMNGLTKYTTLDVNESSSGDAYYLLQALELGSAPKYNVTYKSVDRLKENNYNELFATEYKLISDDIKDMYATVSAAFDVIGTREITGHRILGEKVFETTYASGVKVVTNYNTLDKDTEYGEIEAEGYIIIGADGAVVGLESNEANSDAADAAASEDVTEVEEGGEN